LTGFLFSVYYNKEEMKKCIWLSSFVLLLATALVNAQVSFAEELCPDAWKSLCNIRIEKGNIFGNVIAIILVVACVVSLIFLILGAIKWITSSGDQQKVKQARSAIIASIVGLLISFFALTIVGLLFFNFTGKEFGSFEIPALVP
jgi:hypothetical protein